MPVATLDTTSRMYCRTADVMSRIDMANLPKFDTEYLIRAATARIERYCDRVFCRVPESGTELRHFLGGGVSILSIDDLISLSTITADDEVITVADLILHPFGKIPTTWLEWASGRAWTLNDDIAITGAWGYASSVPWDIWDATVALVVRAIERAKTAYQDASAMPDVGQLIYAKAIPAEIKVVLDQYSRLTI